MRCLLAGAALLSMFQLCLEFIVVVVVDVVVVAFDFDENNFSV